ncbi:LmeA family phospholipid-binding protein [Microbacterium gorillae]|uniref:LmeA family phospholipid-binding protein n=1 Tax=Microbacterium gorillae TaxID=1231063 RepID=UPI0006936B8C|nr:DUF2993 domain-containing protein [Microbacterium gorillae]
MTTTATTPPRRRGWIVAVVALIVVVALVIAAEFIARAVVQNVTAQKVAEALDLPADQKVDVTVDGIVLPQLIAGTFTEMQLSGTDVTVGGITGDVTAVARGVRMSGETDDTTATLVLTADQVKELIPSGVAAVDSLSFADGSAEASALFSVLGLELGVSLTLTPSVADGDLVLTPAGISIGSLALTAEDITQRFGSAGEAMLRPWTVCLRDQIPAGITLTDLAVEGDHLRVQADVAGAMATDPSLQEPGTCD